MLVFLWDYQDGRRLALFGGTVFYTPFRSAQNLRPLNAVRPSVYIETRKGIWERRAEPMDILGLIAVLSFGLTCFGIGYSIGKDSNKTQK